MTTLAAQLLRAWKRSGLTLNQLLVEADLGMSKVSLSRKLRGDQVLSTNECEALARALGVRVNAGRSRAS